MPEFLSQLNPTLLHWVILPILIILARICDVSLGTLRIILIGKGYRHLAPVMAFMEVLIWLVVISHIMQNLDQVQYYFAYALGYASGTFIGMKIESKLSLGQVVIRIISNHDSSELLNKLRENNLNYTIIDATGKFGPVKVIFIIIKRHILKKTTDIIESIQSSAFYTIEDVTQVKGTIPGSWKFFK